MWKGFESFSKLKCYKNIIPGLENLVKEAHVADVFEEEGRLVRDKALKLFENMNSFKRKHLQDGGNVCIAAVHVGRGAERPKQALCSLRLALNSESLQCMWTTISRFYQIEMPQKTSS